MVAVWLRYSCKANGIGYCFSMVPQHVSFDTFYLLVNYSTANHCKNTARLLVYLADRFRGRKGQMDEKIQVWVGPFLIVLFQVVGPF